MERRKFIQKTGLAALSTWIGTEIVFANKIPEGYKLIFEDQTLPGKHPDMVVLNQRPWNIETPVHLLNDAVTPADKLFVRNNGLMPSELIEQNWTLTIDGESVKTPVTFTLEELKRKFTHHRLQITIECGGNGRNEFDPPTPGNQWGNGAVGSPVWTGIRLKDVLQQVDMKSDAVYIGYYGADKHLSGDTKKEPISRGVPIAKALENETLLAFAMNDEPIPTAHGFPLRLVVGGYPASVSGKWLTRISIRNKVHDGEKMGDGSYRMPCEPLAPGEKMTNENACIIESMPVRSIITYPRSGAELKKNQLTINGHAWAGNNKVQSMHFSIDFGATWQPCTLASPTNRFAWQSFEANVSFPSKGYYEIWAKATDENGKEQPMVVPGWNPKGYLNNACHRIAVRLI